MFLGEEAYRHSDRGAPHLNLEMSHGFNKSSIRIFSLAREVHFKSSSRKK